MRSQNLSAIKPKVFDAWAILAHFQGEPAGIKVKHIFEEHFENESSLLISVVNWGEVLYIIEMRYGKNKCEEVESLMQQMDLTVVDADQELTRCAAHFKASKRLPYSDAFAGALAYQKKGTLVTGDSDFKAIEDKIDILWI